MMMMNDLQVNKNKVMKEHPITREKRIRRNLEGKVTDLIRGYFALQLRLRLFHQGAEERVHTKGTTNTYTVDTETYQGNILFAVEGVVYLRRLFFKGIRKKPIVADKEVQELIENDYVRGKVTEAGKVLLDKNVKFIKKYSDKKYKIEVDFTKFDKLLKNPKKVRKLCDNLMITYEAIREVVPYYLSLLTNEELEGVLRALLVEIHRQEHITGLLQGLYMINGKYKRGTLVEGTVSEYQIIREYYNEKFGRETSLEDIKYLMAEMYNEEAR